MLPCNTMPARHTESGLLKTFGGAAFEKAKMTINPACQEKAGG